MVGKIGLKLGRWAARCGECRWCAYWLELKQTLQSLLRNTCWTTLMDHISSRFSVIEWRTIACSATNYCARRGVRRYGFGTKASRKRWIDFSSNAVPDGKYLSDFRLAVQQCSDIHRLKWETCRRRSFYLRDQLQIEVSFFALHSMATVWDHVVLLACVFHTTCTLDFFNAS